MWLFNTSGCTKVSSHKPSKSSFWVTSRPAWSTRYWSTEKALGVRAIRSSPRHRHSSAASSRNGGNSFMALGVSLSKLPRYHLFTPIPLLDHCNFTTQC
jgi:hypothetical protein